MITAESRQMLGGSLKHHLVIQRLITGAVEGDSLSLFVIQSQSTVGWSSRVFLPQAGQSSRKTSASPATCDASCNRHLPQAKGIVKRLASIKSLGGMKMLCLDKAGALANVLDIWASAEGKIVDLRGAGQSLRSY